MAKVRIGIVDDHPLFREGLAAVLAMHASLELVFAAGSADEAIGHAKTTQVDLAIIDILMPHKSGLSLTSELYELQPDCRVLCVSEIEEPGIVADAFRARASGYVLKTQPVVEIVDAIEQVHAGMRYLPPSIPAAAVDQMLAGTATRPFSRLTKREREVFELVIRGLTNDEIADQLFIARRTVETHRQRVMNKLAAHSVVQLQRLAARHVRIT